MLHAAVKMLLLSVQAVQQRLAAHTADSNAAAIAAKYRRLSETEAIPRTSCIGRTHRYASLETYRQVVCSLTLRVTLPLEDATRSQLQCPLAREVVCHHVSIVAAGPPQRGPRKHAADIQYALLRFCRSIYRLPGIEQNRE